MKKITLFAIIFLVCAPQLTSAETVTLSTYYPAPFGTYDRLRLVPRPVITGACPVGTFYTRSDTNELQYCADDGGGGGAWGPMVGIWENDGADSISLVDTAIATFRVGINDPNPDAMLEVSGDGTTDDLFMLSSNDGADGDLLTVDSAGNVSLGGATTPLVRLDLGNSAGDIRIYGTGGRAHILGNTAGPPTGITLAPNGNPAAGAAIFTVKSNGPSERLRVEHNGALKTSNYLEVDGTNPSYIAGNLNVGDTAAGTQTLNVNGGIWMEDGGGDGGVLQVDCDATNCYAVYAP